ncbi:MAG: hypothetical protein WCA07_05285 [Gloeobacterales cyanobacterium]
MTTLHHQNMFKEMGIQTVLVPAGAECQAVQRAMKKVQMGPQIVPIPAGPRAMQRFLETEEDRPWQQSGTILLMGLGGSLSPDYAVGDGVLIDTVWNRFETKMPEASSCDSALTQWLAHRLPSVSVVTGVTCDRVITTVEEKRRLGDRYGASIVDMESAVLLQAMPHAQIAVLRVISDDCHHDLPNIGGAIGPDGAIRPIALALSFLQRPRAAVRLIRSSRQGLKTLEDLTSALFQAHK